ncbi:hypothetical protein LTR36_001126 [Oleoguttula mirabilis]|uniref:D-aminopeptidase n=1 Tax=Oleoguttula mirabilis TaxID=1507867 RepID=A0AAV9JPF9_9PEZI|nr:hypothetical protein LTR36_001126 [Oleoguttula mirabilis]
MTAELSIQDILQSVPSTFRGPGGAVAVVKDGELAGQTVWGYADLDARTILTPTTIFPICSISKQMVCLILTDLLQNDSDKAFENALIKALHELLPHDIVVNKDLTVERLVAMQSGLRDYWALTVLWGATPGGRFSIYEDAPKALKRVGGFHFPPGTQMSYCNTNFMSLGLAIERATGQTLGELLQERLFTPASMTTAALRPDTERLPSPLVGYEGSEGAGYIAYQNRIEWAGDAGIQASLEDMIAYEKYIDRSSADPQSAYRKNAQHPHYIDGSPANYGYGLVHGEVEGIKTVGHGGALAGFRLGRVYMAKKRISVIVLLNSEADTDEVGAYILRNIAGKGKEDDALEQLNVGWTGHYLDEQSSLAIAVAQDKPGELLVNYSGHDEKLKLTSTTHATAKKVEVTLEDGQIIIQLLRGHRFTARPLRSWTESEVTPSYTGSYRSEEIDSTFHVAGTGAMLYGYFDGYLGQGPAHLMRHLGEDVWSLACHRSLDAPAPGDWTVLFHRGGDGKTVEGVTVGCWLARNILFDKTP